MVEYMLDALVDVGVTKIVLALSEIQSDLRLYIDEYGKRKPNVTIYPSVETVPLGTAGPMRLAEDLLRGHRFFMLNSDIISSYPFRDLLNFHLAHGGEGSLMSWEVEDPSRFGVILHNSENQITEFVEKPQTWVGNSINAGHYIFEPTVIDRVRKNEPMSIEREVFPQMATERKLYVMPLEGIWMDIGTPKAFIDCIPLFLPDKDHVLIHETASIADGCQIGPNVVIGPGVVIGEHCCIRNSVIMHRSTVGCGSHILDSIVGWKCKIGKWVRLLEGSVLGEDVAVKDELLERGLIACPHKTIDQSYFKPTTLL
jgi:mannose-1-phosphate guanylyltransferase